MDETAKPLEGHHALVTGGAKGIGRGISGTLAALGARLTLLGRDDTALEQACAELRERYGVPCAALRADLADPEAAQAQLTTAVTALADGEQIDILVNNAGATASAPIHRTDLAVWHRLLEVNMTGTFVCTQTVLPGMRARGWGRIINIASTAGLRGYAYVSAYCAAKHGIIGFTRALALELARTAVTVNAVCPGYARTDMTELTVANIITKTGRSESEALAELVKFNPQGRLIEPKEVAHAVAFLAHPAADSVTGQAVSVAGGETT